jgi:hypothetical protein
MFLRILLLNAALVLYTTPCSRKFPKVALRLRAGFYSSASSSIRPSTSLLHFSECFAPTNRAVWVRVAGPNADAAIRTIEEHDLDWLLQFFPMRARALAGALPSALCRGERLTLSGLAP